MDVFLGRAWSVTALAICSAQQHLTMSIRWIRLGTSAWCTPLMDRPDGSRPAGNLVIDADHNVYGGTSFGGSANLGTISRPAPAVRDDSVFVYRRRGGWRISVRAFPGRSGQFLWHNDVRRKFQMRFQFGAAPFLAGHKRAREPVVQLPMAGRTEHMCWGTHR
jgi:hypothetical protein